MKTVFNNSMCAHVYAQQTQARGRTNNGNMFFEHKTIYSYGYHFPLAHFLNDNTVFINNTSYSPSTGRHQSYIRQAIYADYIISVDTRTIVAITGGNFHNGNKKELIERTLNKAKEHCKQAAKRRVEYLRDSDYASAIVEINTAIKVIEIFKFKAPKKLLDLKNKILNDRESLQNSFADEIAKDTKRRKEANKKRLKELESDIKEGIENFRNGYPAYDYYGLRHYSKILMRIKGDEIETSQGARFPITHGKRAFLVIRYCKDNKEEFETNGKTINLGSFKIDKIESNGNVKAGCHYVEYEEIEAIAKQLNIL